MTRTKKIALAVFAVLALPSLYYGFKQLRENRVLHAYLDEVALPDEVEPWEAARILSASLRERFVVDESSFRHMDMSDRPFLRETSDYLLEINEGQCGEGTRVLVNLLVAAGYDATRVSLFDERLHSTHTLVSLMVDGEEYFVDSINTQPDMNDYLNTHQVNAGSFQIVKYVDSAAARREESGRLRNLAASIEQSDVEERFYNRFRYYSYEALPLTKLTKALKADTRILNFSRPPLALSSLAEKPYRILSIVWLAVALSGAVLALLAGGLIGRLRRRA